MNNYVLLNIGCTEGMRDILIAELAEVGFEGFIEGDNGFEAYIPELIFDQSLVDEIFIKYDVQSHEIVYDTIAQQNWNEQWESSFEPVVIDGQILIVAPFHSVQEKYLYQLTIQPKTSFGTGHHETTVLMMRLMMLMNFKNKDVFDYGSGTGILAIFASMLGAKYIFANDIDEWASENIFENAALNEVSNIEFIKGDLQVVYPKLFDIILANINKNILMQSFAQLALTLNAESLLLISGFYETDLVDLLKYATDAGFGLQSKEQLNGWCAAVLIKKA